MTTALPNGSFSATLAPVEGRPNLIIDPPSRNWPGGSLTQQEEFLALAPGLTLLRATWEGARSLVMWMHDGTLRSPGIISGGGSTPQRHEIPVRAEYPVRLYFRLLGSNATAAEAAAAPLLTVFAVNAPAGMQ